MRNELYKLFINNTDIFSLCSGKEKDSRWHFCIRSSKEPYFCFIFDNNLFVSKMTYIGGLSYADNYNIDEILLDIDFPQNIKDFIVFNLDLFSPKQGETL